MIDIVFSYGIIGLFLTVFIALIIGTLRRDLQLIRMEREGKKHPYAAWRRARPKVHIYIVGTNELRLIETKKSVSRNAYKNKTIHVVAHLPRQLSYPAIIINQGACIDEHAILAAMVEKNFAPTIDATELTLALQPIDTTRALLKNYRTIASSVPQKARSGFGTVARTSTAVMITTARPRGVRATILAVSTIMFQFLAVLTIIYATYLAFMAAQPQLLLTLLAALISFMIVTIWSDSRLRISSKLLYSALLPVALPYFYLLGLTSFWSSLYSKSTTDTRFRTSREYANS